MDELGYCVVPYILHKVGKYLSKYTELYLSSICVCPAVSVWGLEHHRLLQHRDLVLYYLQLYGQWLPGWQDRVYFCKHHLWICIFPLGLLSPSCSPSAWRSSPSLLLRLWFTSLPSWTNIWRRFVNISDRSMRRRERPTRLALYLFFWCFFYR